MKARLSGGTAGLAVIVALVVGICGCGGSVGFDEKEQARETARLARENNRLRRAARRETSKARQKIVAAGLTLIPADGSGCTKLTAGWRGPVDGVLLVSCADLGDRWPLTVGYGFLRCERGKDPAGKVERRVVFAAPDAAEYALSEDARLVGYERIVPIFRRHSGQPRYRNALTRVGMELCALPGGP
jgi:hypothetical protein